MGRRIFWHKDIKIELDDEKVYAPAEDTFLLLDSVEPLVSEGDVVLEIGVGSGIIALTLAKHVQKVVGIDISKEAVKCTKNNVKTNRLENKIELILGDLFNPLKTEAKFDLILFNPPYLPSEETDENLFLEKPELKTVSKTWNGLGLRGRKVIDRFINGLKIRLQKDAKAFLVHSSLNDLEKTLSLTEKMGLKSEILAKEKLFFEELFIIKIKQK
ncbi:MAG: HemK2/MTQ2 family protein methyltransferase [Asgard group archaeon]